MFLARQKPTGFTVRQSILQVKMAIAKQASAVGAGEAFRMELLADGVQTVLDV